MTPLRAAWVWGAVAIALAVGLFAASGHDDSHITYWAAYSLEKNWTILNYNGERVEQSSALATTVILAIVHRVIPWVGLPLWGEVLSLGAASASVLAGTALAERIRPGAGWLTAPILATQPALVYWSASGLETSLACLGWILWCMAIERLFRDSSTPATVGALAATALVVTVRPESALVLGCAVAVLLAARWRVLVAGVRARDLPALRRSPDARLVGAAIAATVALLAWRRLAFHAWFPAPVSAKIGGELHLDVGLAYLATSIGEWGVPVAVFAVAAAIATAWRMRAGRAPITIVAALALAAAQCAFAVGSGGDWMECARFLVPAVGVAAVAGGVFVAERANRSLAVAGIALAVIVQLVSLGVLARTHSCGRTLPDAVWMREALQRADQPRTYSLAETGNSGHARDIVLLDVIEPVIAAMRARTDAPIVIYSGQAGMVPFYLFQRFSGLVFVDADSLTTHRVNACLPRSAQHTLQVGRHFWLATLIRYQDKVRTRCGVGTPDVVYESGPSTSQVLAGQGYVVVHDHPTRHVRSGWLGNENIAGGWVAVRADWAQTLGFKRAPTARLALPARGR